MGVEMRIRSEQAADRTTSSGHRSLQRGIQQSRRRGLGTAAHRGGTSLGVLTDAAIRVEGDEMTIRGRDRQSIVRRMTTRHGVT